MLGMWMWRLCSGVEARREMFDPFDFAITVGKIL